ncbi:dihydropyrimidinase [Cellulosimicrobium sp. Marseille-Q8652]
MPHTLIRGGTVVGPTGSTLADVLVDGEQVAALLRPGDTSLGADLARNAERVVDATGKYVVPGAVDCHTHMELPFGGTHASDTFETGTRAAAWGGTTTIVDFAVQRTGERVQDGLAAWHEKAAGRCAVDYGFHQILGGVDDDALKAMDELVDEGITSFKLFMAYPGVLYSDDGQILRAMQKARDNGSVVMMHAENGIAIDVLVRQALDRGDTGPFFHGTTRPWETEEEATHRAIMLARLTGAPLYVVHMSAKQAVETLARARGEGWNVFGETCPQYLYLSLEEQLAARSEEWGDLEGAKWVCSTPLRSRAEGHQDELWRYLRTGDLSVVSTDHCPFCMKEQKELGRGDFSKIPNGIGGVEHRLDLLYQGVVDGKISRERWVELCCTTPARMFGLDGRKGVIAPGADADVVVYDPAGHTSIGYDTTHHMNMDHSAWEGFEVDGHVDVVMSRGRVLVEDGAYHGSPGHGQFLRRGLSAYLR